MGNYHPIPGLTSNPNIILLSNLLRGFIVYDTVFQFYHNLLPLNQHCIGNYFMQFCPIDLPNLKTILINFNSFKIIFFSVEFF